MTLRKRPNTSLAIVLAGALAFVVVGCSSAPEQKPAAETPAPSTATTECDIDTRSLGDAIASELIEDEFGEYCKLKIDRTAAALKFDPAKVVDMDELLAAGFTEEDLKAAQKASITFLVEQTLDSTRLDNSNEAADAWITSNGSYFSERNLTSMTPYIKENGLRPYNLIITDILPAPLLRDGSARAMSIDVQLNFIKLNGAAGNDRPTILVGTSATAVYPVSNAYIVDAIIKNNSAETLESLKATSPQLFTEEINIDLMVSGAFNFAFDKEDPDGIGGTGVKWDLNTTEGFTVASSVG